MHGSGSLLRWAKVLLHVSASGSPQHWSNEESCSSMLMHERGLSSGPSNEKSSEPVDTTWLVATVTDSLNDPPLPEAKRHVMLVSDCQKVATETDCCTCARREYAVMPKSAPRTVEPA